MKTITCNLAVLTVIFLGAPLLNAAEVDELRERASAMKKELAELMEQKRYDAAEKVKLGLAELGEQIERREAATKSDGLAGEVAKKKLVEAGRRLKHIYQAAEHLTAAGMEDMADQLRKHAAEMEKEIKRASQEASAATLGKKEKSHADDPHVELKKMREQVEKLQAQVDELRAQLKH